MKYTITFKDNVSMDEQDDFLELYEKLVEKVEYEE